MIKKLLLFLTAVAVILSFCSCGQTMGKSLPTGKRDVLVVYFSRTGNTADTAKIIADYTQADIFTFSRQEPYPENLEECVAEASREMQNNIIPEITDQVKNIEKYNVIFLCYPIWLNSMPMPVITFMTENNLSDKYIIPVATHSGSGFGDSIQKIQKYAGNAKIMDGLSILNGNNQGLEDKLKEYGF